MVTIGLLDWAFVVPLFILLAVCSYTDVKYGKIFNKWILGGFLYGLLLYCLIMAGGFFSSSQIFNFSYLGEVLLNGLIALVVGFSLWSIRLWSAGDAKLFAVCAFLLPLKFYSDSYLPYFPSFNLLVNLFIPLFFWLVLNSFIVFLRGLNSHKEIIEKIIEFKKEKHYLKLGRLLFKIFLRVLDYFLIFILIALVKSFIDFNFLSNPFFIFFVLLGGSRVISAIKEKTKWASYLIGSLVFLYLCYLFLSGRTEEMKSLFRNTLIFTFFIILIRQLFDLYIERKETKKIKIQDIKKGFILSQKDATVLLKGMSSEKKERYFGELRPEGLTERQVNVIKNLFPPDPELEVRIYRTFPFAPFMLFSVFASLLTKSSFLIFLR